MGATAEKKIKLCRFGEKNILCYTVVDVIGFVVAFNAVYITYYTYPQLVRNDEADGKNG